MGFVKADHSVDYQIRKDGSKCYSFCEIEGSDSHLQGRYGTLNLDHSVCCYLCLSASNDPAVAERAQYCLSQFHLTNGSRNIVIFCATYSLQTCLEAVHSQYSPGCAPTQYHPKTFKFHDPIDDQTCLIISCEPREGIKMTAYPTNRQILASEINFWRRVNNEGVDLRLLHKFKMYPPRVTFEIDCTTDVFMLNFKFTGFPESTHLDREIMFPLSSIPS